jgi:EAL domain-containing protein (putative c-di-GMP-specific phosphodiesterase class I)
MAAWQRDYTTHPPMTVSVNLSARELDEPGLVGSVRSALEDAQLDPAHLVLEITESLLLVDLPTTVGTLLELRALGVRLAVDDFGTGYSSLAYLENLPVDILKIDKSFVDRIADQNPGLPADGETGAQRSVMVSAISQLAHALSLQMEQVSTLRGLACQYGQGFYFARPLTADALRDLLIRQEDEPGWSLDPRVAGSVAR